MNERVKKEGKSRPRRFPGKSARRKVNTHNSKFGGKGGGGRRSDSLGKFAARQGGKWGGGNGKSLRRRPSGKETEKGKTGGRGAEKQHVGGFGFKKKGMSTRKGRDRNKSLFRGFQTHHLGSWGKGKIKGGGPGEIELKGSRKKGPVIGKV